MRSSGWGLVGLLVAVGGCGGPDARGGATRTTSAGSQLVRGSLVDIVGATAALSSPAQRHMVRIEPPTHAPVHLLAVENDGYTNYEQGLLWYRSDDGGLTWSHYAPIVARPDPAVYDASRQPATLHLTADLIVVGNDIAAVYSYDSTSGTLPADAWDPARAVYFQWWRFDGVNDWVPGPRTRIAAPGPGQAYHRAEVARDSAGRIWIQAFLRQSDCSQPGSSSCVGDLLRVWVSSDAGATFQGPQTLASVPNNIGGGRLLSIGTKLVMLWSDTSPTPARLMTRDDGDPITAWSPPRTAFSDGTHIYHGSALSAVADGEGGLHLVYKQWVSFPDNQQLFYRHFDGAEFGPAIPVGSLGDWALQPAITRSGTELYVCSNQTLTASTNYEMRAYRLGAGFSTWTVIDDQVQGKAYPAAPEIVPPSDTTVPCAFGMGDQSTSWWGAGHVVSVGHEPVLATATAPAATPVFTPAGGTYTTSQKVTILDATSGATIHYTVDGTTPTTSSTVYTGPILVAATTTIRAIAGAPGFTTSAVASATYTIESALPGPTGSADWPFYRGDVLGQSFVDQPVTVADAAGFTLAWTHSGAGSVANPIVVGGVLYTAEENGQLVALDAATGRQLWSQPIGTAPATSCHPWVNGPVGAPAVVGNTVFAPGGDGAVHAFARDTGEPLWSTQVAILSPDGTTSDEFLWSSAFPLHGRIYVGVATLGENRCGPTPGRVAVLDQATGAVFGTWWVDPQHRLGATVWTQPVYDAATNRLFFTTGQGDPSLPLSSEPTAQAFVAIDADTLQPLDSLQPVSSPFTVDYDFGASPTLVDTADGRPLVVAANKDGIVYAADRDHLSNGVVWSYQVSVPGDSPDLGTGTIVGAAYAHGTLFVGGGQTVDGFPGSVAALDPATGTARWVFHTDGFVLASLLAVGDVVVAQATHLPDRTGRIYVLDQSTGKPVLQFSTPGPLHAQATFAAGKLFVVDDSGQLYAFTPGSVPALPPAATPLFTPAGGTYVAAQSVTISDATPGAAIHYTVDGSTPTTTSPLYTSPVPVAVTTTLQAIAVASGYTVSPVASATYTIQSTAPGSQNVFSDDFSRTSGLGPSWRVWYGSYSTDGSDAVSGPAPAQGNWASVVPAIGTDDYTVSAAMSFPPGALYSGIVARGSPGNFTSDLYAAQLSSTGAVNLYRRNAWTWTLLGSAGAGVVAGTSYTLQLSVKGASPVHLEVSLDGSTVITVDDASGSRITSGAPGIENYDANVRYGRFEVSKP